MSQPSTHWTKCCIALAIGLAQTTIPRALAADRQAIIETMARATSAMRAISTEGGYVYLYSTDRTRRTAERPATATQITMQPPGTPSMGLTFLHAYEATGDKIHLAAARAAASALARCQLASGGWHSTADFDPAYPNEDGKLYHGEKYIHGQIIKHTIHTTFDDDTTQSAVRFLTDFVVAVKGISDPADDTIRTALNRAIEGMARAQYPNGAWPQCYAGEVRTPADFPIRKSHFSTDYPREWPDADYTRYYTLNDNCQGDCIMTLLDAAKKLGRTDCLEMAKRGGDFLLLAQLPEPQPAWAQQYDFDMQPAWARVHEAPGVSSSESGSATKALLDLYLATGESKYLDAAEKAVAWLRASKVGKNRWSRLYELGTNKPIYGDDRGKIFYSKAELHPKFASGYVWESKFRIPEVFDLFDKIKSKGREAVLAEANAADETSADVPGIIAALNESGYWITPSRWRKGAAPEPSISTKAFIMNMEILAAALK